MFGVLLFLSTSYLLVCVATSSIEVTGHPKTNLVRYLESQGEVPGISSLRQVVPLFTFLFN
jgi:hypothetical protein